MVRMHKLEGEAAWICLYVLMQRYCDPHYPNQLHSRGPSHMHAGTLEEVRSSMAVILPQGACHTDMGLLDEIVAALPAGRYDLVGAEQVLQQCRVSEAGGMHGDLVGAEQVLQQCRVRKVGAFWYPSGDRQAGSSAPTQGCPHSADDHFDVKWWMDRCFI